MDRRATSDRCELTHFPSITRMFAVPSAALMADRFAGLTPAPGKDDDAGRQSRPRISPSPPPANRVVSGLPFSL